MDGHRDGRADLPDQVVLVAVTVEPRFELIRKQAGLQLSVGHVLGELRYDFVKHPGTYIIRGHDDEPALQ